MRTLRSGIHMLDVDRPPKVIHVTSARPGEGKTTIAISLAISAALGGLKVVLVDAERPGRDLREKNVGPTARRRHRAQSLEPQSGQEIRDQLPLRGAVLRKI